MDKSLNVKKIEAESWRGPLNHDNPLSHLQYATKWDNYLLNHSSALKNIKGLKIINVGGGYGKEAEFFIENWASLVAIVDIAKEQLISAKLRITQHNLKNIELFCNDAENLCFKNNTFDMGIFFMALHHFPDHEKAINQIFRVSKTVFFIDIMNCDLTKLLNRIGLFKEEWCGIEPNRIEINNIRSIFKKENKTMTIKYFFCPPYYGGNVIISQMLFNISLFLCKYFLKNEKIGCIFGNIAIIEG